MPNHVSCITWLLQQDLTAYTTKSRDVFKVCEAKVTLCACVCVCVTDSAICEWCPVQYPVYSLCETGSQRDGEIAEMSPPAGGNRRSLFSLCICLFMSPHRVWCLERKRQVLCNKMLSMNGTGPVLFNRYHHFMTHQWWLFNQLSCLNNCRRTADAAM